MESYSLYLHIPFCRSRCSYCDFNTYAGMEYLLNDYSDALCSEIEFIADSLDEMIPAHTIYFGGGTPSLLNPKQLDKILNKIHQKFQVSKDLEVTLEANPGTVNSSYLNDLHCMGINRLSIGMQSAIPEELRLLGRSHNIDDVINTVKWARQAGIDNLNLDLIFGLPGQSLEAWQHTLELALLLQPEHLSLYSLTVEHGTPMYNWLHRGLLPAIDSDLAADMYEWASIRLEAAGYAQYEISNWAKHRGEKLLACHHNLQYWKNRPYLGFGAGAHGYANNMRVANVLSINEYIDRCFHPASKEFPRSPATNVEEIIDYKNEMAETIMMGLRLTIEGVSSSEFKSRFGKTLLEMYQKEIDELITWGLLEWIGEGESKAIRITKKGRILGNQVFIKFI